MRIKAVNTTGIIFVLLISLGLTPLGGEEPAPDNQPTEQSAPEAAETAEQEQPPEGQESSGSVWSLLVKGGYTMIGLLLISTIIAAFALERYFFFRRKRPF